jgi:hypothetical protein
MIDCIFSICCRNERRKALSRRSLQSFFDNTDPAKVRTYAVFDGGENFAAEFPFDYTLHHKESVGVALSLTSAIDLIRAKSRYYVTESRNPRHSAPTEFISYHQDDLLYSPAWLPKCVEAFALHPEAVFVSGWKNDHLDHPEIRREGDLLLKHTLSGQHLMARRDYWFSIEPPTMLYGWNAGSNFYEPHRGGLENPQGERGNPGPDGMCSRFDWYLMIDNPRSPVLTHRPNIALDVMTNIGKEASTWLAEGNG